MSHELIKRFLLIKSVKHADCALLRLKDVLKSPHTIIPLQSSELILSRTKCPNKQTEYHIVCSESLCGKERSLLHIMIYRRPI